jgi:putative ABC transport system substrate-binding protein
MRRRDFIAGISGSAAAWPIAARAQQPAMPVIGYLYAGSAAPVRHLIEIFRRGLAETGYIEGQNVIIDYRFAEGRYDRLSGLAGELVRRQVSVIVSPQTGAGALAVRAATSSIPIVFSVHLDPVKLGLVTSLARPGGNATGVNFLTGEVATKRLGLLCELIPAAKRIALLINPNNPGAESTRKDLTAGALTLGVQGEVVHARDSSEIERAFATLINKNPDALLVAGDALFTNRRVQLVTLAARHAIPAAYSVREFAEAGGLMSYGTNLIEVTRQLANYTGRILKGANPADLPVVQSTKFELVINLPTARALGLNIPPMLLARADEVIE